MVRTCSGITYLEQHGRPAKCAQVRWFVYGVCGVLRLPVFDVNPEPSGI
jgi:hypothetical protein